MAQSYIKKANRDFRLSLDEARNFFSQSKKKILRDLAHSKEHKSEKVCLTWLLKHPKALVTSTHDKNHSLCGTHLGLLGSIAA